MRALRLLVCLALLAAAAVVAAPAQAAKRPTGKVVLLGQNGRALPGPYPGWAERAKVPTVRGRVRILLSGCPRRPALTGCVFTKRRSTIYLRRSAKNPREVLMHELGHLFDLRVLNARDRRDFKRLIGKRRQRWFRDANPPAEQFAEAYALCALRKRIDRRVRGHYGFVTGPSRHRASCEIIRRRARPGAPPPSTPKNPPPVFEPPPQSQPPSGELQEEPGLIEQLDDLLPG